MQQIYNIRKIVDELMNADKLESNKSITTRFLCIDKGLIHKFKFVEQ